MSSTLPDAVTAYLALALEGEQRRAVRLVLDLLDDSTGISTLVTELLGPAQHEVGERWHRGELTTADEHLVTGVSQAAVDALDATSPAPASQGPLLVACAEGDWHSLPSNMFAALLRDAGRGVIHLGASTPAEDVASFIERHRPDALAVTCNLPLTYVGTTRLVDAAHAAGVPVLAGGRALDARRATILGADGWASDSKMALQVLDGWSAARPDVQRSPVRLDPVALELEARAIDIGERAFDDLHHRFPPMSTYDERQAARTREDLVYIVRFLAAARLVDDPEVFAAFLSWLRELLGARGVPAAALTAGLEVLAPLVGSVDERAAQLLVPTVGSDRR